MATLGGLCRSFAVDRQRPAHQRFGLGQPVRGLEQLSQVVEVYGDIRVSFP